MTRIAVKKHGWELLLGAAMLLALAALGLRNHGLMPYVFMDELSYSTFSRLLPLREAVVPSYLYLWLFSASSACGSGFLECVRYGNELLFVAAAPFLYLSARRVCSKPASLALAMVSLAGPVNSYTQYFMPESTYFFGFWVLAWISLAPDASARRLGLGGGVAIGLLALVKVHALFLLPAQLVFVFAASYLQGGPWLRKGLAAAALTLASMLAVRYGLGYALAGDAGLRLFGSMYGSQAASHAGRWAGFIPAALSNLQGHLMALALLLAFPLALLCQSVLSPAARRGQERDATALQLYAFLMLAASLGMTVLYTASLNDEGQRLHMRYYNFTFPLLFMVGAAAMQSKAAQRPRAAAIVLALGGAAALAWSAMHLARVFRLVWSDGAEAAAMTANPLTLYALAAAGMAVLALWTVRPRLAGGLFVFGFLPLFVVLGGVNGAAVRRQVALASSYDSAGMFVHSHLSAAERATLAITGGPPSQLMRAKFHADAAAASMVPMDEGAALDTTRVRADRQWLLVIGQHALPAAMAPLVRTPAYALVRMAPARELFRIDLTGAAPDMSMLADTQGLSKPEPWGRWSEGPAMTFRFKQALPRKLVLVLTARAFGPNAGKPITVRVGQQERQFVASEVDSELTLRFDPSDAETSFTILVPEPSRPTAPDGRILDPRWLGVGLSEIRVASADGK